MAGEKTSVLSLSGLQWMKQTDILMGIGIITIVAMLIIPLPTFLLDFFMAVSIMLGLLILMIVMYIKKPNEFSIFPSLLLITTVFRLALNVSSTRLILLNGASFDGKIIRSFGQFVVGGNYIVGFIVFIILVAVQFIVITKGATRTAEVSARFTLDALPGKQMSVDADISSGRLSEEEGRKKKEEIQQESDFYGAMDGASKFVQGDVKVGIIITIINLIGGFAVGMVLRGESFDVALKTYTLLSIGDGLVSQIPSLLITTATGIIVTRAVSDNNLGSQIGEQLMTSQPRALYITAAALGGAVIIPGFPKIPLILLSAGLASLGYVLSKKAKETVISETRRQQETAARERKPESVVENLRLDPLEVELGVELIPLVDEDQGGILLERIANIRKRSALEMGLIVPQVRIRDNLELPPQTYSILIKGVEVARGTLQVGKLMAMDSGSVAPDSKIEGTEFTEPVFGLKAIWIDSAKKSVAEIRGYSVIDCPTIIATHFTDIIKKNAAEILGRQEVKELIENLRAGYPAVVDELESKKDRIGLGLIQKVLQNLLKEQVSIKNMLTIVETIITYSDAGLGRADADVMTEYVRAALSRQISSSYADDRGNINVITVDPEIESAVRNALASDPVEGSILTLSPEDHSLIVNVLIKAYREAVDRLDRGANPPVFLVSPHIRSIVFSMLEREFSSAENGHSVPSVLSYNEIPGNIHPQVAASALLPEE